VDDKGKRGNLVRGSSGAKGEQIAKTGEKV